MDELFALVGLFVLLFIVIYGIGWVLRLVGRFLFFDWFGINYDDPTSPYYHDKHGKGRGHGR